MACQEKFYIHELDNSRGVADVRAMEDFAAFCDGESTKEEETVSFIKEYDGSHLLTDYAIAAVNVSASVPAIYSSILFTVLSRL